MRTRNKLHNHLRKTALALACCAMIELLSGCSVPHSMAFWRSKYKTADDEPTIKTLSTRTAQIDPTEKVNSSQSQAIDAYRNFLSISPAVHDGPWRAEAMRRIGDLEMSNADQVSAQGDPDYSAAIASYQEYLKSYPDDPGNDKVLYQLARGQEQSGDIVAAQATLNRLVRDYPQTQYGDEAQFRLGELLFASGAYAKAEQAYAIVIKSGKDGKYYDRAVYMQGWSQFKQGQLDVAVESFFRVLDLKLPGRQGGLGIESIPDLTRADRELLDDTFRVIGLSLENLQGAESIPVYITTPERHEYEFRVYEQLAELYLKQERIKDAADTYGTFAHNQPLHELAPLMQSRVIDIYQNNGFASLALQAKRDYVERYGRNSEFKTANPTGWQNAQEQVRLNLADLARYCHATAQRTKTPFDYGEAIHWYREYLISFPQAADAPEQNFLLAELLFEIGSYADASAEYEKVAYQYPAGPHSADAGYAALLGYARQLKAAEGGADQTAIEPLQRASVASALHFADQFPADPRVPPVLTNAAERLYELKDSQQAAAVAKRVVALKPPAAEDQRRVAWTVIAYTSFDAAAYEESEQAFGEVLALTAPNADNRNELIERRAAAVYKQGEQARADGKLDAAVANFSRVASVAPASSISATAQYDAAAALIAMKEWDKAGTMLEDFRKRYPKNPLVPEAGTKLAAVYLEKGDWHGAAVELDAMASAGKDSKQTSDLLWQAAELHEKSGSRAAAAKDYERYLALNRDSLVPALEARSRLAAIAKQDGNATRELGLMKEILTTEQNGGAARNDRTHYLGAVAALALAEPVAESYRKVALVEPLQKNLKLKKARMEESLKAYAVATDYGVADVSTEATYKIATIYRDFGKALMDSERPKKLSKVEREQYDVLLEEQAYPFEEKAIEIHEVNTHRSTDGIYDKWVQASFAAMRELKPARYNKTERADPTPATSAAAQADSPASLNRQGIAYRQEGQFDKAAAAYQQAIDATPPDPNAILNLAVLNDLYLGDNQRAMDLYTRYMATRPDGDAEVGKWIKELQTRMPKPVAPAAPAAQPDGTAADQAQAVPQQKEAP